jgi:hypothetical protein
LSAPVIADRSSAASVTVRAMGPAVSCVFEIGMSIYHPETVADEEKLKRLSRILRTVPWQAAVGRRVDGARELGSRTAAAEFSFRLTWRDALGGRLFSQPIFRAEFARSDEGWKLSSCRIVGTPKL